MTRASLIVVFMLGGLLAHAAAQQDSIAAARELYTTAGYEEALSMLDRLRSAKPPNDEALAIEQYRAFSLFALGRSAEAEQAVEAIVAIDPAWELADSEAPPRIVGLFTSVRERALPNVLRQRFTAAKGLYNEKKHDEAIEAFSSVLLLMEQPSIAKVEKAELTDLKTMVSGFQELAKAAAEQAKTAARQAKAAEEKAAKDAAAATPAPTQSTQSTGAGTPADAASSRAKPAASVEPVLPPSIITQQIPRPMGMAVPLSGESIVVLDVLVDELGRVERATIRRSANRIYEAQLLAAARGWRYTPATQAGKPVKYVKTLEITLTPR
jgi:TonB family protein